MTEYITIGRIEKSLKVSLQESTFSKIGVLVDENTRKYCLPIIEELLGSFVLIEIQSGELNKNINTCNSIWNSLTKNEFDRHSLIINLGGGVIGDMGGFCAATFKRGITFINIPTTLLAMVDASIGGKLGIDHGIYKNQIGLFQTPHHVFIDDQFLATLPKRELKSGFAEVIKHSLISKNDDWELIKNTPFEQLKWEEIIRKSIAVKSTIVNSDFKEQGLRKVLNFGHTIGHAIESYFLENSTSPLLHGEAVAIGMICETYLSFKKSGISENELNSIVKLIMHNYEKVEIKSDEFSGIIELTAHDKKNARNKIQAVLLKSIGMPLIDSEINSEEIGNALNYYNSLNI